MKTVGEEEPLRPGVSDASVSGPGGAGWGRVSIPLAVFLLMVGLPWLWFSVTPDESGERIHLAVKHEMSGWTFSKEVVTPAAMEQLSTTNMVNGAFTDPAGNVVTVFAAEWHAASARSMSVVNHTPDICWVGGGWKPLGVGQPRQVSIALGGRLFPFECRVFSAPGDGRREIVIWCTLVGGQVLPEASGWGMEDGGDQPNWQRASKAARRLALHQFVSNLKQRRGGTGDKQFVRLSTIVTGNWEEGLRALERFSSVWLSVSGVGVGNAHGRL